MNNDELSLKLEELSMLNCEMDTLSNKIKDVNDVIKDDLINRKLTPLCPWFVTPEGVSHKIRTINISGLYLGNAQVRLRIDSENRPGVYATSYKTITLDEFVTLYTLEDN